MAYNNGFPMNYQPAYPIQQPVPQPQMNTGLTWVQGEAGAKAYPVAPNTTVDLWDSEEQVIYLKSADMSGMPSMKILDYTIRDQSGTKNTLAEKIPEIDTSKFVTYEDLELKLKELTAQIDKSNNRQTRNSDYRRRKERNDG